MALFRRCGKVVKKLGKIWATCDIGCEQSVVVYMIRNQVGYVTIASKLNSRSTSSTDEKCYNWIDTRISESADPNTDQSLDLRRNINKEIGGSCDGGGEILEKELMRLMRLMRHDEKELNDCSIQSIGSSSSRLVRYCDNILAGVKPSERRSLMQRIWNIIENKLDGREAPTLEEYNALLKVFGSYSQSLDPEKFLKSMKVPADTETYKLLLNCAAKSGNVKAALYILSLMKVTGGLLNEQIFNSLVELYARTGDIESVLLNIERMRDSGIEPSAQTWTNVARAYATIGDIIGMEKVLKNEKGINDGQIMEIVEGLLSSNNGKSIEQIMKYLSSKADFNNLAIVNAINELAYAPNGEYIYLVVDRITSEIASDKRDIFLENYLKTVVGAKTPFDAILKIIDSITDTKKYYFAITDVCGAALENGENKLAMRLLEMMRDKKLALRAHYFWPLLVEAPKSDGEAGIFRMTKHMLRLNVCLDYDTFLHYIFPRIDTCDVSCVLLKFGDIGLEPSSFVTPLISYYLLSEGNFESSLFLCAKYTSSIDFPKILHPLGVAYKRNGSIEKPVEILSYAPRADNYYPEQFLMNVFGKMPRPKDVGTVNKLIESFETFDMPVTRFWQCKEKIKIKGGGSGEKEEEEEGESDNRRRLVNPLDSLKPFNRIPHPRDMSLDQLECHLIELRSKGMNKRGVLRKLLLEHCRRNNVERVNELKKEYDNSGYLWSSGLYCVLFKFYTRNAQIREATHFYQLLREYHTHFKIDADKLVSFASALVENKQIEQAIRVVKSPCDSSTAPSAQQRLNKECWRLLNTVAHSEFSEMTQDILDILVESGYCQINNMILGPMIRQHLLKNNVDEAVESFKKYAEQYKCTPLRQELIVALLKLIQTNDSSKERFIKLLDDVQNITTKIYGPEGLKVNFFLGLARTRMHKELYQFFEDNYIPSHLFVQTLEHIAESEKLSTLSEIFHTCTNLPNTHKNLICEHILFLHCRYGDCQGAIELWRKMNKADVACSRKFMIKLVNLLKSHNITVPEDLQIPAP